jgi:hypothetical protein
MIPLLAELEVAARLVSCYLRDNARCCYQVV